MELSINFLSSEYVLLQILWGINRGSDPYFLFMIIIQSWFIDAIYGVRKYLPFDAPSIMQHDGCDVMVVN